MSQAPVEIESCLKTKITTDATENDYSIYKLIPFEEVKEITKRVLDSDAVVTEYTIRPCSDGKIGFLGSHYRLNVIASVKKGATVNLSLFLKAVPYEVSQLADYVIGVFHYEIKFYNIIMPLLREGYRGEPWAPMCYKMTNDLMIFEDLGSKGYSMRDKLFDETLVRAGLNTIARMHAASLLAETRLAVPLDRLHPEIFKEKSFPREGKRQKWFNAGVDVVAVIAERLGHDPHLVRMACERIDDITKPSCTKLNVVSHGDLWGNNLMFSNDESPNCMLVDFQLVRYSPLAHDVAQLLYLCTDRSFREARETAMLRYYYETLCEILKSHEMPRRPTWSEVVEGMEEQRLGAVITATMFFPTVLMDENSSAQLMNNSASYVGYYLQDRKELVLSNMKKDPIYERRINEVVNELGELALRLDQLPRPS